MPSERIERPVFRTGWSSSCRITATRRASMTGSPASRCSRRWARRYWPVYFETVRDRLKPGRTPRLQIITVADERWDVYEGVLISFRNTSSRGDAAIARRVLRAEVERAGLDVAGSIEFGESYCQTLRRWHETFNDRWDEVAALGFDDRFRRMWNFYLTSCAARFHSGNCDVTQITVRRPV